MSAQAGLTIFSHKPTLIGSRVILRPIQAEDADAINALIAADPEIAVLTGSVHSSAERGDDLPLDELRRIYGEWAVSDSRLVLAILDQETGELVGESVLNTWDEGNQSCGFRILIGAPGRGRGLGTEATRLTVDYGIRELNLHRISLEVYDFNPRARHVYEKVGFVYEGTGRDALRFDEEWIDVHFMAVLSPDWLATNPR